MPAPFVAARAFWLATTQWRCAEDTRKRSAQIGAQGMATGMQAQRRVVGKEEMVEGYLFLRGSHFGSLVGRLCFVIHVCKVSMR